MSPDSDRGWAAQRLRLSNFPHSKYHMTTYFECHVTLQGNPSLIRLEVEKRKWKFSVIDGDPVLGDGIKCYATRLFNKKKGQASVQEELFWIAEELKTLGHNVLRRKIELVIYDDRSVKVNCTGGCIGCHLDDLCSTS
jgi:hypothetical protein